MIPALLGSYIKDRSSPQSDSVGTAVIISTYLFHILNRIRATDPICRKFSYLSVDLRRAHKFITHSSKSTPIQLSKPRIIVQGGRCSSDWTESTGEDAVGFKERVSQCISVSERVDHILRCPLDIYYQQHEAESPQLFDRLGSQLRAYERRLYDKL